MSNKTAKIRRIYLLDMDTLLDPITSSHKMRRYSIAQLVATESKLHLIIEQYEEEKASHLKNLGQSQELQAALHDRIAGLLLQDRERALLEIYALDSCSAPAVDQSSLDETPLVGKLVAQVRANASLKAVFAALPKIAAPAETTAGMLVLPPALVELQQKGIPNHKQELKAALTRVEVELSASLLEASYASGGRVESEQVKEPIEELQNTSESVWSITSKICVPSFVPGDKRCIRDAIICDWCSICSDVILRPSSKECDSASECPELELERLVTSVSQVHNNTTFHPFCDPNETKTADSVVEDVSMTSVSFRSLFGQRSGALDITGLDVHSRTIFDRFALFVAEIQEALDQWSLKAAAGMLSALNVPEIEEPGPHISFAATSTDLDSVNLPLDTVLHLVISYRNQVSADLRERLTAPESRLIEKEARVAELKAAVLDMHAIYDDLKNQFSKANEEVSLAESLELESSVSLELSSSFMELEHLQDQNLAVVTQLKEQADEHEMKMNTEVGRYETLPEMADAKYAEIWEQFQRLQTEHDELLAETKTREREVVGLESDVAMAPPVSVEPQLSFGGLVGSAPDAALKPEEGGEDLETVRQKAQKYSKLKEMALELKNRLVKRK
ncbi:hypothetical protein Aperf_G00000106991 [Anoplocephala perfoliata]